MANEKFLEPDFPREIGFDPQMIATVLHAKAERPSEKVIKETLELGIDLTKENTWEIFLYDDVRKIEQYLELYPERKVVTFHTRVRVETEDVTADFGLGFLRLTDIDKIIAIPAFGHVWFESSTARLDVYHDCHYGFVTNIKND